MRAYMIHGVRNALACFARVLVVVWWWWWGLHHALLMVVTEPRGKGRMYEYTNMHMYVHMYRKPSLMSAPSHVQPEGREKTPEECVQKNGQSLYVHMYSYFATMVYRAGRQMSGAPLFPRRPGRRVEDGRRSEWVGLGERGSEHMHANT